VQGGAGNDVIVAGPGSDGVSAGDGNDLVNAGTEAERAEEDAYDGGPGFDTLDYSLRTTPIFAATIGTTGRSSAEADGIANFERVIGGAGNDSILGFSSNGGAGDDVLTGGNGGDTIVGGTGADTIRGFAGNDTLDANDGVRDTRIDCSTGFDTVLLDLKDPNPTDAENCESIDRRKVDEEPGTRILSAGARVRDGRAGVRLRCPRAVHQACAGTLTLAARHAASARYRIAAGRSAVVAVPVGATDAARVRRAAHGLVAVATSRERGLKSAETVIRRLTLRA
jgi:Ca2+-binding RTX toxin-like protein